MIVGFSKHGRGTSRSVVRYLTSPAHGGIERVPVPVVLRGEPELVGNIIDASKFKHRYTSGVLSFAPGEKVTDTMEQRIMDEFERVAFSGLQQDSYAILWVRHLHAGHHELHFLTPRTELAGGRSLNIAPPGKASRSLFDAFRRVINFEYGLADPEDPSRSRQVRLPHHVTKLRAADVRLAGDRGEDPRELISVAMLDASSRGLVRERSDVLRFLTLAGFQITRAGANYVSVRDPGSNDKYRLKGALFSADLGKQQTKSTIDDGGVESDTDRFNKLNRLKAELECHIGKRAKYNRSRYTAARSDLWDDRTSDVFAAARVLENEITYQRKSLETTRLRHASAFRDGASARGSECLPWVRCRREAIGRTRVGSDTQERARSEPILLCSEVEVEPSGDRDRATLANRIRAFGKRVFETGSRLAKCALNYAASLGQHDREVERYDDVLRAADRVFERFKHSVERVARALGGIGRVDISRSSSTTPAPSIESPSMGEL